jgi:hypothetical protein
LNNLYLTEQNIVDEDSYHSSSIGHGTAYNLISMGPLVRRGSAEWAVPVGTPISHDNVPDLMFQSGTLGSIRSATPCKQGCAADTGTLHLIRSATPCKQGRAADCASDGSCTPPPSGVFRGRVRTCSFEDRGFVSVPARTQGRRSPAYGPYKRRIQGPA